MLIGDKLFLENNKFQLELKEIDKEFFYIRHKRKIFLYVLINPINKEIRYIGLTNHLSQRFNSHMAEKNITWKTNWINSLKNKNLKPKMLILGTINLDDFNNEEEFLLFSDKVETEAIIFFGKNGYKLTNHDKLIGKGYNYSPNPHRKNTKKVYQFDENFKFIKEWNSQVEIYNFFKVNASTINGAIKNKIKVKGYYFSFEKKDFYKEIINYKKKCYVYDLNMNFIGEFESIKETSKKLNITKQAISSCINGRSKNTRDYKIFLKMIL